MTNSHLNSTRPQPGQQIVLRDTTGLLDGPVRLSASAWQEFERNMDLALDGLEARFAGFITHRSTRGALGR